MGVAEGASLVGFLLLFSFHLSLPFQLHQLQNCDSQTQGDGDEPRHSNTCKTAFSLKLSSHGTDHLSVTVYWMPGDEVLHCKRCMSQALLYQGYADDLCGVR